MVIPMAYFSERQNNIVSILKRLVEAESPTSDKAAVDRVGAIITRELKRLEMQVAVEPQLDTGDHIIGRWSRSTGTDRGGILVLCHMDTVHPIGSLARNPCREQDGRLYGPGVQDMKGGIAILLAALKALREQNQPPCAPISVLFTSDEETGSHSSRSTIERLARGSELVLCLEPSLANGELKTARKGVGTFVLEVQGRAAHSGGHHEQGRNAIEEISHHVLDIQALTDYSSGTTLNVGVILGGSVSNVVPEHARAEIDLRVLSMAEAQRVTDWLQSRKPVLEGTALKVTGSLNRPPMPRDERMATAFERARRISLDLGLELGEGSAGGGSDANFVAPLGVTVLDGLGAQGDGMHSDREHILIRSLPERAALLAAILSNWEKPSFTGHSE